MNLILVGLNHNSAPVKVRECLAPEEDDPRAMLSGALALDGVREAMLVATCNRVELLAVTEDDSDHGADTLGKWLSRDRAIPPEEIERCLYTHRGQEAIRHLFRVASSLDSMVVGEPQILGQIKDSYRKAAEFGATRAVLNKLLHKTFQVAKKVRTQTNIGGAAVSVSYAAVELAKKIFDQLDDLEVLLVGAGEMAELAAEHLKAQGVARIAVANRTLERAMDLARRFGDGPSCDLGQLPGALSSADIVITSTGADRPLITWELAKKALRKRRGRPVFFIDIAVPRDVEPKVADLDGAFVYDMDDLSQVVEKNRASRELEAKDAERIVAAEVITFSRWLDSLAVVPTIAELSAKGEALRKAELERTLKDLGDIPPEQAEALERLTKSLVKKLLHDPIIFLKNQAHPKSSGAKHSQLALARRMFGLEEDPKK